MWCNCAQNPLHCDYGRLGSAKDKKRKTLEEEDEDAKGTINMEAALKKGLNMPIPESNVGHRLLAKMGYRPGQSLGKSQTGLTAPISILSDVGKSQREGLGVQADREREKERRAQRRRLAESAHKSRFVGMSSELFARQQRSTELTRAQSAVARLDMAAGFARHALWGRELADEAAPDDEDDEHADVPPERREPPTIYEDAETEPHAPQRHPLDRLPRPGAAEPPVLSDEEVRVGLSAVLRYLRDTHLYCFYCGAKFSDQKDMDEHCPGPDKGAHDDDTSLS